MSASSATASRPARAPCLRALVAMLALFGTAALAAGTRDAADTVFTNGVVYTVDAKDTVAQALAVRGGRIVYVGDDAGAAALAGPRTQRIDLQGRMLMPGLVDAHMHPQSGGLKMLMCNLEYARLTLAEFRARIQRCLDAETAAGPDEVLQVINWFQQDMEPKGLELTHKDLDALETRRPVIVRSSFGHSTLANARAIELAGLTRDSIDPPDGHIWRDANGEPTGLFEDGAQPLVRRLVPDPSAATHLQATRSALAAMRAQGITAFLDASTDPETLAAYRHVQRAGELTARAQFGVLIDAVEDFDAKTAVDAVLRTRAAWDSGAPAPSPALRVNGAKLFLDGIYNAPTLTGVMVEPYFTDHGPASTPRWRPGTSRGPKPYFSPEQLTEIMRLLGAAGIDPHIHADGDGAVRLALDAYALLRREFPGRDLRPAIAHAEIVDPADYRRFAELGVSPVLSFQWGKPAADTVDAARDHLGPLRFAILEPQGLLELQDARIAFGSDWPVDALDEWFALQVALTRSARGEDARRYPGRLGVDPGLSLAAALRAMTLNAAYTLRLDAVAGSLEAGKFADLIVLDRNLLQTEPAEIGQTKVLLTMVGGRIVHRLLL